MVRALAAGVGSFSEADLSEEDQADGIEPFTPLPATEGAVRELASALELAGVEIGNPLLECTQSEFTHAWEDLLDRGSRRVSRVVHFAGHGHTAESSGVLYLATAGSNTREDQLTRKCVSVGRLLEEAENSGRPVLFLLDVCEAGQALVQQQLTELAARRRQDTVRNVWIIGACSSDAITYGARFTTATAEILRRLADGDLDISSTQKYVPIATLAEAIDRHLARTNASAGRPRQHIVRTPHVHAALESPPFFRNPAHNPDPRAGLLAGMDPRLREFALACSPGLDPLHFATRAAGEPYVHDILFSGRISQLQSIQDWTNDTGARSESGLLVVTGSPGIGKSALLGVTACLLHPELTELGDRVARIVTDFYPRRPAAVLAVHTRQLTLQQITDSLRQQLRQQLTNTPAGSKAATPSSPSGDSAQAAAAALVRDLWEASDVTVILDALDEAADPTGVLNELLLPLASTAAKKAGCRVMIGTRPWWDTLPALRNYLAEHPEAELSLDPVSDDDRRALANDLDTYLRKLLPPRSLDDRERVRTIADRLAEFSDHGAFLVAALYANHLTTTSQHARAEPPRTVTEVFDLHVDALAAENPWIRPVLTVLGQARGQGMPLDLIHAAALAQHTLDPGRRTPQLADTRRVLTKAAFFLRTTPDTDHRVLYRYFHQSLADHTASRTDPAALYRALIDTIPSSSADWGHAHPYLLRHAAAHAVAAGNGVLDRLLVDPGFLVHAEPDFLTPHLHHARCDQAKLHAHVYRTTTAHDPRRHQAEARLGLMALDAASWQQPGLARTLALASAADDKVQATPMWATRRTHPARLHTLTGHTAPVRAVATVTAPDGTLLAITASDDSTAIVWNPTSGTRLHTLDGHTKSVRAVATATAPDGTPLAITAGHEGTDWRWGPITASGDGTAIVWNPTTGTPLHTLDGHTAPVRAVATATAPDGTLLAITASDDSTAIVWNPTTGTRLHTLDGHTAPVQAVATVTAPDGTPLAITASDDGTAIVWNPTTGTRLHILERHTRSVVGVATSTAPDGAPLAIITEFGTVIVWDPITGTSLRALEGHTASLRAVATVTDPGSTCLAITVIDDGTAIVWNLTTGTRLHTLTGHTGPVQAVATVTAPDDTPLAITASDDGTAIVWNLTTDTSLCSLTGHTGRVGAVATVTAPNGTCLGVTAGADGTAIVWNLTTGTRLHNLTGHTGPVQAVATVTAPNGTPLAITSGSDRRAIVWNLTTGTRLHNLEVLADSVFGVATAPDGTPLAITASRDGTAIVWNPTTGTPLHTLTGHTAPVQAVATVTAPDGTPLAITASDDGTAIVWNLTTGQEACCCYLPYGADAVAVSSSGFLISYGAEVAFFEWPRDMGTAAKRPGTEQPEP
ncbi:hypothetical protein ACKI1K_07170 [Streptomyces scabiei]|uniref:hypothetical protein n=1 Tax=Streptomyces scabiei TaxID=1930 RepID=UPI0038F7C000